MKKLSKLSINMNKVMKNEELVNLKGGYAIPSQGWNYCYYRGYFVGAIYAGSCGEGSDGTSGLTYCKEAYGSSIDMSVCN